MYDIYEKYISEHKNANLIHSIQMGSTYNLKKAEHRISIASRRKRYVERNLYWCCSQISLYLKTTAEEHDEGYFLLLHESNFKILYVVVCASKILLLSYLGTKHISSHLLHSFRNITVTLKFLRLKRKHPTDLTEEIK